MIQLELFKLMSIGNGMRYKDAKQILSGRNNVRMQRDTYLVETRSCIAINHWRVNGLLEYYPDGRIEVHFRNTQSNKINWGRSGGYNRTNTGYSTEWSARSRVNFYLPYDWHFFTYRYHTMLAPIEDLKVNKDEARECPPDIEFDENGNIRYPRHGYKIGFNDYGRTLADLKHIYKKDDLAREKPRRRGRYWVARARNLYRVRCRIKPSWKCDFIRDDNRTMPKLYPCGCRTFRKNIKFHRTVNQILQEPNATVRTCMIRIYGVQQFFDDVGARSINKRGDYDLLELITGERKPGSSRNAERSMLRALKMVCPSTGQVYVHLVPDACINVPQALDWMFNTRDYINTVGQQT